MQKAIDYLKGSVSRHLLGVVVAVLVAIGLRSYMAEHDARLVSDALVKAAQSRIEELEAKKASVDKAAKAEIVSLQDKAAVIKTPRQAVDALPDVAVPGLDPVPVPEIPDAVAVKAVPLYQALNECKRDAIALGACQTKLSIQEGIDREKDGQISTLKGKGGFWHRVKSTAITLGIGAATGYVLRR